LGKESGDGQFPPPPEGRAILLKRRFRGRRGEEGKVKWAFGWKNGESLVPL
jgi:hypothetical protein